MSHSYSAIILSGGLSTRFGQNKSLTTVLNKPLILYVIDAVKPLIDNILVVTDTEENKKNLLNILPRSTEILMDELNIKSPIIGAFTGLKHAKGRIALVLSCDTPLISTKVLSYLLEIADNYDAVIPKWPNGYIEPLQAAYQTEKTYKAALQAINCQDYRMRAILIRLQNVKYISTTILLHLDPKLNTLINVNTPKDLEKIERILKNKEKEF